MMRNPVTTIGDRIALTLLGGYRHFVSPLMPPVCRFYPTCSAYAEEAVRLHGWWRGIRLALRRVLRCHPLRPGGFDPVPGSRSPVRDHEVGIRWAQAQGAARED